MMKKNILILFILQICNLNAQVNWKNVSTLGMGYVDGITVNPISNQKYIRTDVGGIFRFDDANQKWLNLFDNLITINQRDISSVESFAIDKTTSGNNQVIYALSGNYGYKSYLLKSVNNGQTWTINQDWDETRKVFGNGAWRCSGEKLAIDPNNSNVVYCGTRFDGLYKTTNAASNWSKVTSFTPTGGNGGLPEKGGISFVVFDPTTTVLVNTQTVSKNIYVGLIDEGIYRSNDGGVTWCFLANGFNINTYNPVRAVFGNNKLIVSTMQDAEQNDGQVWQFVPNANDCQGTWTNKTPGLANNFQCPVWGNYKFNAIAVRPGNPNTVYVAIRGTMPRKIFYTQNFDAASPTWKILTTESANDAYLGCAANVQASTFAAPQTWVNTDGYDWVGDIAFDASDNKKLWMTSGNGVMTVADITANPALISSVNVMKDLEILCVNQMVSPPAPNTTPLIIASMDTFGLTYQNLDNGTATKLNNTDGLGAGISLEYSFQNPNNMVYVGQDYNAPQTINRVMKSNDGGLNWQTIWNPTNPCTEVPWGGNITISSTNPNNIIWVPSNTSNSCSNTLKNFPRYSTNGGATWNFCNNINFTDGNFPFSFSSAFSIGKMLESDKVNGNKFYYYAMEGNTFLTKLWQTTDGGANWTVKSTGVMPITGNGQLKANPFVENDIWFAPFNTYILQNDPNPNSRKLWRSQDGGTTWSTLTTIDEVYAYGFGMKKAGTTVASLIVYGKLNDVESIYISYDLGLTFTNLGTTNIPEGIMTNIEGDMKVNGRYYISTGCRGAWYGDVPSNLAISNFDVVENDFTVYPNPTKGSFSIQSNIAFQDAQLAIYDLLGRNVKKITIPNNLDKINVTSLAKGTYILKFDYNNKKPTLKLVVE
jgi:xyloglucan-specific exo-beta-1,4-glucanase